MGKTGGANAYGNFLSIIGFSGIISTVILGSLKITGKVISEQTTPSYFLNILLAISLILLALGIGIKSLFKN